MPSRQTAGPHMIKSDQIRPNRTKLSLAAKKFGCGYFLATRKALKNKAIVSVAVRKVVGKCRVIDGRM